MEIGRGEFPGGVIPATFLPAGIRNITWDDPEGQLSRRGVGVAWSRMFWNDSNPALAERYAPIFRTDLALPVAVLNLQNVNWSRGLPRLFALCFWRIQAHNMEPREGIVEVCSPNDPSGIPSLPCIQDEGNKTDSGLVQPERDCRRGQQTIHACAGAAGNPSTCRWPGASSTWWLSWTGTAGTWRLGGCPTPSIGALERVEP